MSLRTLSLAVLIGTLGAAAGRADNWIFDNGPYTVNPQTGQRVEQYQAPVEPKPVPYEKFFSQDGPHPYIPYQFYYDELGWPGVPGTIDEPYGGGWGGGDFSYGFGWGGGFAF